MDPFWSFFALLGTPAAAFALLTVVLPRPAIRTEVLTRRVVRAALATEEGPPTPAPRRLELPPRPIVCGGAPEVTEPGPLWIAEGVDPGVAPRVAYAVQRCGVREARLTWVVREGHVEDLGGLDAPTLACVREGLARIPFADGPQTASIRVVRPM
ncbi:MAG: hypothetical protein H6734_24695 [Alphaproteobacteria bacterium]|nr:hypothetical protein [Alphaproteobacteria bacterium]